MEPARKRYIWPGLESQHLLQNRACFLHALGSSY
jgi:hypothetical protein